MKLYIETLGCPKNFNDSEGIAGIWERSGMNMTDDPAQADAILVNTCGFINDAKKESIDKIFEMADFIEEEDDQAAAEETDAEKKILIVSGCLSQRYGSELFDEMPEVDIFLGVNDYEMPDAPQRIATDTSQKLAIRFGETIKAYEARGLDKSNLVLIPLVLAGYARYLKGVDDNGKPFEISPDPLLAELQAIVAPLEVKEGEQDFSCLKKLYSRADVFGVDLYAVGLGEKIEGMVKELYAGNGAVRKTLHKYTVAR